MVYLGPRSSCGWQYIMILLSIIFLICTVSQVRAATDNIVFTAHDWDLFSSFSYTNSILRTTLQSLAIAIEATHVGTNDLPLFFDHLSRCRVVLNNDVGQSVSGEHFFHDGASWVRYAFNTAIEIEHLSWTCGNITIHPSRLYQLSNKDTASVKIRLFDGAIEPPSLNDAFHQSPEFQLEITNDTPMMIHHYNWGGAEAAIVTKFTFFRPTNMKDKNMFSISHPLLNLSHIQSMHLPPNQDKNKDLLRLTHLLQMMQDSKIFQCLHPTSSEYSSTLKFDPASSTSRLTLTVPSDMPPAIEDSYSCMLSIRYPPDVFYAVINQQNQSALVVDIEPIGDATSGSARSFISPNVIPQDYISDGTPQSALVWLSPHHKHDAAKDFEFGVATTRHVYNADGGIDMLTPFFSSLTLDSTFMLAGEFGVPIALKEWSPSLECREHAQNNFSNKLDISTGLIDLKEIPGIFGWTCRLELRDVPQNVPNAASIMFSARLITDGQPLIPNITVFGVEPSAENVPFLSLYDTSLVSLPQLPQPPQHIRLTTEVDISTGITYGIAHMNLQLLLPYQITKAEPTYLHLIFANYVNLSSIPEFLHPDEQVLHSMTILSRGIQVLESNRAHITMGMDYQQFYPTMEADEASTIFRPGMPIYSPRYIVQFPSELIRLDATQPLEVTLRFPIKAQYKAEIEATSVYPVLLSSLAATTSTYTPGVALFTPPRQTALTGYSYRCVTWDRMTSAYVYGNTLPLTNENSFECPSYDRAAEPIDVGDKTIWRRVVPSSFSDACFYELAAVCVTPARTAGQYNVHPIADCPSFLGQNHAIPCRLVEGDNPSWNNYFNYFNVQANGGESLEAPTVKFTWMYSGDARMLLKLQARVQSEENPDAPWVLVTSTIPAFLSPYDKLDDDFTIPFPRLHSNGKPVELQLILDGADGLPLNMVSTFSLHEKHIAGCTPQSNKMFDPDTHLCVCATGFDSDKPSGLDNPFIHPNSFDCLRQCNADSTRNPRTNVCEPNLPDAPVCHAVPKDVLPPFRTNSCEFGVPDEKECTKCECLSRWVKNSTDGKCDVCKLSLEAHCVQANVDPISFRPEYCWVGRCLCKTGFYGDRCEHKVIYGTIQYVQPTTIAPPEDGEKNLIILKRSKITEVQDRILDEVKLAMGDIATDVDMFIRQATQQVVYRDGTGENPDEKDLTTSIVIGMKPQQSNDGNGTPFVYLDDTTNEFGHLYDAWQHVQDNGTTLPADAEFGQVGGVQPPYDPHCVPNAFTHCPDGEDNILPPENQVDPDEVDDIYQEPPASSDGSGDNTTTYIIIGVVVGAVLILFIALIVAILYCRKHGKMCYRKRKSQTASSKTASHHASSTAGLELTKASSHSSASSAPPSATMSTSSYLPTQVAIADPTLPADWIALEDKSTGKVYYSNKVTMESSWDHPAKPKEKVAGTYGW